MAVPSVHDLEQMPLPQRIKKTREGLGLSQEKFASQIGTSARQVKRWERGDNSPTRANGVSIAKLAKRPEWLFTPPEEELTLSEIAFLKGEVQRLQQAVDRHDTEIQHLQGQPQPRPKTPPSRRG